MLELCERRGKGKMLKVVVFDSGYGGELFADLLEEELPILEVIRVIDWRHAEQILKSAKTARAAAEEALRPYIGRVDLIVLANHLLSFASLNYFRQKFENQKFVGFEMWRPDTFFDQNVLTITTTAASRTAVHRKFVRTLKRRALTLTVDSWPGRIDDGELDADEIRVTIRRFVMEKNYDPSGVVLACGQLNDIKDEIERAFDTRVKIYSSFDGALRETCKALKLRSSFKKK